MSPNFVPSTNRVIWITGASGGLGRQLVQQFHTAGDTVIASYREHDNFTEEDRLYPEASFGRTASKRHRTRARPAEAGA